MLLSGVLNQVASDRSGPPPSGVGAEIFRMYVRKEIDFPTYLEMTAITVSKDAHKIAPRAFPVMPSGLRAYCQDRVDQRREYDAETGKRLGVWVWRCIRISEENSADLSLLLWAKEKLLPTGLKREIEEIDQAIPEFMKVEMPKSDFSVATQAQALDSLAREKTR